MSSNDSYKTSWNDFVQEIVPVPQVEMLSTQEMVPIEIKLVWMITSTWSSSYPLPSSRSSPINDSNA